MEKVKGILKKDIEDIKISINKEKISIFLVTFLTTMIVHFQLYAWNISGADNLLSSMYHQADVWEICLRRFGLYFMQLIRGNIVSPILSTLICSILLGITVNIIIAMFKIKSKYFKYLLAIIFAVAPNISATLTFFYCSDAYILGLFLATLAVFLVRKYENKKSIILVSGLLIALSIGMYQTYLSVTMVLCIAMIIIDIFNNVNKKQILNSVLRYILMGVSGVALFFLFAHIALLIANLQPANYSGANEVGLQTIGRLLELIPQAYQSFFNYFFNDKMIPNTIWGTNIFYAIIFIAVVTVILYITIKNKTYKNIVNTIILIISILIIPVCFGIIELILPEVDIHILMACSMIYIFPIFFKILEMIPKDSMFNICKTIVAICSVAVIWIYIWQDNASYIGMKKMQNGATATTNRLVTRIEQLEDYKVDMPVLLLGGLENNKYLNAYITNIEAEKVFDRGWGFISYKPPIWWGSLDSWNKMLYEYIGANLNLVSEHEEESKKIFETEEYKNMTYYPEKDSIKIINGTVVVKLSD